MATTLDIVHSRFLIGLGKSFGIILASEIGDKTFFIAAIMAMRNPRLTVCSPRPSLLARAGACGAAPDPSRTVWCAGLCWRDRGARSDDGSFGCDGLGGATPGEGGHAHVFFGALCVFRCPARSGTWMTWVI